MFTFFVLLIQTHSHNSFLSSERIEKLTSQRKGHSRISSHSPFIRHTNTEKYSRKAEFNSLPASPSPKLTLTVPVWGSNDHHLVSVTVRIERLAIKRPMRLALCRLHDCQPDFRNVEGVLTSESERLHFFCFWISFTQTSRKQLQPCSYTAAFRRIYSRIEIVER